MRTQYLQEFLEKIRRHKNSLFCLAAGAGYLLAGQPQDVNAAGPNKAPKRSPEDVKKLISSLNEQMASCNSKSLLDRLLEKRNNLTGELFAADRAKVLLDGTDACPGTLIPAGTSFSDTGTTIGANNTVNSIPAGCSDYSSTQGPDKIYKFALPAVGSRIPTCSLTVTPTGGAAANYDVAFYILSPSGIGCPAGTGNTVTTNCIVGNDNAGINGAEALTDAQLDAIPAGVYFLFIDSFYNSNPAGSGGGACTAPNAGCFDGPFTLQFNCTTVSATAAFVGVGGRVTTSEGQGISKARVSVILPSGEERFVITNPFGFYRFDDIEVGQSYVFQVSGKGQSFSNASQLITVNEEINNLDFVADGPMTKGKR